MQNARIASYRRNDLESNREIHGKNEEKRKRKLVAGSNIIDYYQNRMHFASYINLI